MSFVERRRFRPRTHTRENQPQRILFRAHAQRFFGSWYLVLILTVCLGIAVLVPAALSYDARLLGLYEGYDGFGLTTMLGLVAASGAVLLILALFVAAPLVAEDRRTRATTFYFSGPLRAGAYLRSKFVAALAPMLGLGVAPAIVTTALIPLHGWPRAPRSYRFSSQRLSPSDKERWAIQTIDTFGEWLLLLAVVTAGLLLVTAFLASLAILVSCWTRRAWHAGFTLLAILGAGGALGMLAGQAVPNAFSYAFGPLGWMYAVTALPVELLLRPAAHLDPLPPGFQGGWWMVLTAAAILAALTVVCVLLAWRRVHRWEAPQ